MIIESSYSSPLDQICQHPSVDDEDYHVYQSLDDVRSHGSVSNILGKLPNPPKAPTPVLKRRPLSERSNLPPLTPKSSKDEKIEVKQAPAARSRRDRFLFWKHKSEHKR